MDKQPANTLDTSNIKHFPVSVVVCYKNIQNNPWSNGRWEVTGLLVGEKISSDTVSQQPLHRGTENTQQLWTGFTVELHKDDVESYYNNLASAHPSAFVICRQDELDSDQCRPFLVTLSYDEATSYLEVDELVYSVDLPAELYLWMEQFILVHYIPEKKKKRKRVNWSKSNEKPESISS